MQYCQACGYSNSVGVYGCTRCGASLATAPMVANGGYYAAQAHRKSPVAKALLITGGIIAFLVVAIIGGLYVIGTRVEKQQQEAAAHRQAQITAMANVQAREKALNDALQTDIKAIKPATDEDVDGIATRINAFIEQARAIDLGNCPQTYADAYNRDLASWTDEAHTVREHPHIPTEGEAFANGFVKGLEGDSSGGAQELKDKFNTWTSSLKADDAEIDKRSAELKSIVASF
jgi:hypothetical protein